MTGDLRQVPLGARKVRAQLRAELAHKFTKFCRARTEGARGVPRSQRLRETTDPTLQSSKTSGGLTASWDGFKMARATFSPTFHTRRREVTKFENVSSPKSRHSMVIDFQMVTIHTGRYGGGTQDSKT